MGKLVAILTAVLGTTLLASEVDKATLDHIKPIIEAYAKARYKTEVYIDTIAKMDSAFKCKRVLNDSSKHTVEYYAWGYILNNYIGKFLVHMEGDNAYEMIWYAKVDSTNDDKLGDLQDSIPSLKARLSLVKRKNDSIENREKVKSDSIFQAVSKKEDERFTSNKKKIALSIKSFVEKNKHKLIIDSLVLENFYYDDTIKEYWKHINERDYKAWIQLDGVLASIMHVHTTNDKVDSFDFAEDDETENDQLIQRKSSIISERREKQAINKLEANRPLITSVIKKCIQEYANDPTSIQIAKVDFNFILATDVTSYIVVSRGKNAFGALIRSLIDIRLDKNNKCLEFKHIEE